MASTQHIQDNVRVRHSHEHSTGMIKLSDSVLHEGMKDEKVAPRAMPRKTRKIPKAATATVAPLPVADMPSVPPAPSVARSTHEVHTDIESLDVQYNDLAEKLKDILKMTLSLTGVKKAKRESSSSSTTSTTASH